MFTTTAHTRRVTAEQLGPNASVDLAVWLFFQLAAYHVLLPLLIATFFISRTVVRRPTLINVCCTWIVSGVAASLLVYLGEETGADPGQGICTAQAAILSGALPMTSVACLALVYDTWSSFSSKPAEVRALHKPRRLVTTLLLCAPYLTLAVFLAIAAKLGVDHPTDVDREAHFFYCSMNLKPLTFSTAIFSALACVASVALQSLVVLQLWRNRRTQRRPVQSENVDVDFCIRVELFTLCMLTATVANLVSVGDSASVFPDMFIASVGLAVFLIFGTQRDVLHVWLSWRHALHTPRAAPGNPRLPRAPYPSFDLDLMKRTDSDVSEKARLEALRAYYSARVRGEGVGVEIIERPEDAFIPGRDVRRASGVSGYSGKSQDSGTA